MNVLRRGSGPPLTLSSNADAIGCWRSSDLQCIPVEVERHQKSRWVTNGQPTRCAYCGEPFTINEAHVDSVRVGREYACDVFCAEALHDQPPNLLKVRS